MTFCSLSLRFQKMISESIPPDTNFIFSLGGANDTQSTGPVWPSRTSAVRGLALTFHNTTFPSSDPETVTFLEKDENIQ